MGCRSRWRIAAGLVATGCVAVPAVAQASLPDGRAYELVTPPDKPAGVGRARLVQLAEAAAGGDRIVFDSFQALPDSPNGRYNVYVAQRGDSGWTIVPIAPAPTTVDNHGQADALNFMQSLSDDGLTSVFDSGAPLVGADQDGWTPDIYLDRLGDFTLLSQGTINQGDTSAGFPPWGALSADGSHAVFGVNVPILPEDTGRTDGFGVYQWHDGELHLVNVDSSGTAIPSGSNGARLGNPYAQPPSGMGLNPISADGSHIFFTADFQLYVRVDDAVTKKVVPGATAPEEQDFMGATPDGSLAFFTSAQPLTSDDHDSGIDLYEYRVSDGRITRISTGASGDAVDANVIPEGVRLSDDGSRVYYLATGSGIAPGAPSAPDPGTVGIYLYDHGATRYVAQVNRSDVGAPPPYCSPDPNQLSDWRTTPDGQHLLFGTSLPATSDDTDSTHDLFEFSVANGKVVRVSQGSIGGNGAFDVPIGTNALTGGQTCPSRQHEVDPMTGDGTRVFFETAEALEPGDVNGQVDVYERNVERGTTSLLTAGTTPVDSHLLDVSASGRDVFVSTFDRLSGADVDDMLDIYDIRAGGRTFIPHSTPACREDDCQPAVSRIAGLSTPGSSTVQERQRTVQPRAARVRLRGLTAAQRRALAAGRTVRVRVTASVDGRIALVGRASAGRRHLTAFRASRVAQAGRAIALRVRLDAAALAQLRRHGHLAIRLTASLTPGGARAARTVRVRAHRRSTSSTTRR